jgi:hypothetical protein
MTTRTGFSRFLFDLVWHHTQQSPEEMRSIESPSVASTRKLVRYAIDDAAEMMRLWRAEDFDPPASMPRSDPNPL